MRKLVSTDPKALTRHHRKPRKLGGTDDSRNIAFITREKHEAWHMLFNHMSAPEIAHEISKLYLDPDYEMVAVKRSLT